MATNCSLTTWNRGNCTLDQEALLPDGVSLRVPDGSVTTAPAHGGNFLLSVFRTDAPGTPVIQYGSGFFLDPSQGHYPAGTNSTFPLVPLAAGDYFVVVETADGIFNCGCLDIPEWNICTNSVQMNYEGETNVGSFEYTLPIEPGMTEIQWKFITQTIPDQLEIIYNGTVLYDSGLISTGSTEFEGIIDGSGVTVSVGGTPSVVNNPFVYVSGVDEITVRLTPDGSQPAGTSTIFGASVGCCEGENVVEKPFRDPYFNRLSNNLCSYNIRAIPPYVNQANSNFYKGNFESLAFDEWHVNLDDVGGGCLFGDSSIVAPGFANSGGCNTISRAQNSCQNYGLAVNRNITNDGNGLLTLSYMNGVSGEQICVSGNQSSSECYARGATVQDGPISGQVFASWYDAINDETCFSVSGLTSGSFSGSSNITCGSSSHAVLSVTSFTESNYQIAKSWYKRQEAFLESQFGLNNHVAFLTARIGGKNVLCDSDGPNIGNTPQQWYHPKITSFDDINQTITHDYNLIGDEIVEGQGCCPDRGVSSSNASIYANNWEVNGPYLSGMASTAQMIWILPGFITRNVTNGAVYTQDSQGRHIYQWMWGINVAQGFTHSNPVQEYNFRIDAENDFMELWRGPVDTGVLLQACNTPLTDPNSQYIGSIEANALYTARSNGSRNMVSANNPRGNFVAVVNEDRCPLQTADILGKPLDLSYYGGLRSEVFSTAQELLDRINSLPGVNGRFELFKHNTEFMLMTRDVTANYKHISCAS